jgi:hypothetical protein
MCVFIDGGNIGTELSHFLLCLCEIRLQGIEVSFKSWLWVWAMMMREPKRGDWGQKIY